MKDIALARIQAAVMAFNAAVNNPRWVIGVNLDRYRPTRSMDENNLAVDAH